MLYHFTPRVKKLAALAVFAAFVALLAFYAMPFSNSQMRHLTAVRRHLAKIAPDWERFKATHEGFQEIKLFAYTGGDGMIGATGLVPTDGHLSELRKFVESTLPPRPLFLVSVHVVGPEYLQGSADARKFEPTGPANGSQPPGPTTNSTPAAAGSRR